MIMDYFKNLLIGLITGIAAYLNPISGEIKSLIAVFALNFICGLLTALLINHESFSFKKAWRCIVEATIFFALVVASTLLVNTKVIRKVRYNASHLLRTAYSIFTG